MTTETLADFKMPSSCWPDGCRLFNIMKTYKDDFAAPDEKRCEGDSGWLMLTHRDGPVCPFEKKRGRQRVFLYSKGKAAVVFNDDSELSKCLSNTFSFFQNSFGQKLYIRRVLA